MRNKSQKNGHDTSLDGMFIVLILTVAFVLINVVLTVNGMSPFELLK